MCKAGRKKPIQSALQAAGGKKSPVPFGNTHLCHHTCIHKNCMNSMDFCLKHFAHMVSGTWLMNFMQENFGNKLTLTFLSFCIMGRYASITTDLDHCFTMKKTLQCKFISDLSNINSISWIQIYNPTDEAVAASGSKPTYEKFCWKLKFRWVLHIHKI